MLFLACLLGWGWCRRVVGLGDRELGTVYPLMGEHVASVDRLLTTRAGGEGCRGFNIVSGGVNGVNHDKVGGGAGVKGERAYFAYAEFPAIGARAVHTEGVCDSEGSAGCRRDDGEGRKLRVGISGEGDAERGTCGGGIHGDSGDEVKGFGVGPLREGPDSREIEGDHLGFSDGGGRR